MNIDVGLEAIAEASEKLSNWGRWGAEDQIGTLNYVTADDVVNAARLVRKGKVFALGIPLDANGPQSGIFGRRFNPILQMLHSGADGIAGRYGESGRPSYADDTLFLCVQGATHWDALGHVHYRNKMYNGYDAALSNSAGIEKNAIQHTRDRMVGRGVLLDIARFRKVA
ncbi:MAG: cyclase family protein, partial [Variibacter sp.]|nr:cyclase family protein [Variibacter sp.]